MHTHKKGNDTDYVQ